MVCEAAAAAVSPGLMGLTGLIGPVGVIDLLGWLAAALTWLAFAGTHMNRLRGFALAANLAFIGYSLSAGLWPVLALHLALAPVNLWRLIQLRRQALPPVRIAVAHH